MISESATYGRRRHVRQESAQLLPALSAGRSDVCIREEQSEILFQSAVDGVLQRKRHHSRNELCRHAARERAHSEGSGYGLARRLLGAVSVCARDVAAPHKQDSGQQERAAGSVTESHKSLLGREFLLRRCRGGNILARPFILGNRYLPGRAFPLNNAAAGVCVRCSWRSSASLRSYESPNCCFAYFPASRRMSGDDSELYKRSTSAARWISTSC